MKEKAVTKKQLTRLRERGAWAVKYHGDVYATAGVPDILFCYRGQFGSVESKAPGRENELTEKQRLEMGKIMNAGGLAIIASDVQVVDDMLDGIDEGLATEPVIRQGGKAGWAG